MTNEIKLFIDAYSFRLEPATLGYYQNAIAEFLAHSEKAYNEASSREIRNWLSELEVKGYKTSSRNTRLCGLKLFYRFCMEEGLVQRDPAKSIPISKVEDKLPYYLSMEQWPRLREVAKEDPYYRVVIETLYATGIRISELAAMKKEDINWSERSILILKGKRKRSRIVLFTRECGEHLSRLLETRQDKYADSVREYNRKRTNLSSDCPKTICPVWRAVRGEIDSTYIATYLRSSFGDERNVTLVYSGFARS